MAVDEPMVPAREEEEVEEDAEDRREEKEREGAGEAGKEGEAAEEAEGSSIASEEGADDCIGGTAKPLTGRTRKRQTLSTSTTTAKLPLWPLLHLP